MAEPGSIPDRRLVVLRAPGTIGPPDVAEGSRAAAGTPLGCIRGREEQLDVSAAWDGVLAEWPVHDGDRVDAGDPLARLYPEVSQ